MILMPALIDAIQSVPEISALPTVDQMNRNTQAVLSRYPTLVDITQVGVSGQGEPIEMISIGDGPMSALFVGAPHPNEPIGCLAIEHLIERLCADSAFRQALPYRWHFIKAIEPDALRMNEGWFDAPGDILRYCEGYYRPPLEQQAEYAFPFHEGDWLDRNPLPENDAWRKAIELARPDFLYSLHNSEFGGAFYLLTDMPANLAAGLKGVCDLYSLPLNVVGDTALNELGWEPGLYRFPDMRGHFERTAAAACGTDRRPVGNSSAAYVAAMGAFSMFAEVPYWDCERLRDVSLSPHTKADVEAELKPWNAEAVELAGRALALSYAESFGMEMNMRQVVQEHHGHFADIHRVATAGPMFDEKLTWSEHTIRRVCGRLERLSTVGMARRLALTAVERDEGCRLAADCRKALSQQTGILLRQEGLRPVPLQSLARFQLRAGMEAMTALADFRS
ncbi:Zinc carboxypeptidase [Chromobacterium violaceum]|uniref:Zinc carboxypeptidase n=2 Tax=Chromobacterium violaceum TaxID=536 RepID=A0A3S5DL28_CHRVL|nr:Zinc carboxypeptidase [Chromobacterium violaceum]